MQCNTIDARQLHQRMTLYGPLLPTPSDPEGIVHSRRTAVIHHLLMSGPLLIPSSHPASRPNSPSPSRRHHALSPSTSERAQAVQDREERSSLFQCREAGSLEQRRVYFAAPISHQLAITSLHTPLCLPLTDRPWNLGLDPFDTILHDGLDRAQAAQALRATEPAVS